ncbi:hypothetical protein CBG25_04000 [Arsenophonus sp. ENCA]|uniref:hypothetical protein n=1 Tax=Arsenophonus sp. ENCA TaxID=1987579 RepID=UPI000BDAA734|nr:hypothetical protein [Arsenophonus sp. ENCA]PAV08399.1 hypothetical protein CBG25_04000 [Arsenophonus sp. ENCA]
MALSPALMDLIAGWYDWVAQPNIDPSEMRETALNRVFTCITNEDSSLNLSKLNLTSLPNLPEWIIKLDVSDNQLTRLPNNLPKQLTHLYAAHSQSKRNKPIKRYAAIR